MSLLLLEIVVILLLLVLNGVFAMTEMAMVAARKTRLQVMADQGHAGARAALRLARTPNQFLPAVQFGITLVGLLAGAFGGITIAEAIAARLQPVPALAPYAAAIGVAVVVALLTYLSLIIGELVPKRLALANPELIASRMARPMDWLGHLARPVIWLLGASTELALRCLRVQASPTVAISDDEVQTLLQEGVRSGVFHSAEPRMIASVLALDQQPVRNIMTPRERLVFLQVNEPHARFWHKIVLSGHSNFPVYADQRDQVVGLASLKAIYANLAAGEPVRLAGLMEPPLSVPDTQTVTELLERFRKTGRHIALVNAADGKFLGLVTLVDVLEAIVGELPSLEARRQPRAVRRADGSWLVDGAFACDRFALLLNAAAPGDTLAARSDTIASFVLAELSGPPREGATLIRAGLQFEIIDLDGHRIDKVLIRPAEGVP